MKCKIRGTTLPVVDVELKAGESIISESGAMAWMSNTIQMESHLRGGLGSSLGRVMAGESMFLVTYTAQSPGSITFCNEFPGKIVAKTFKAGEGLICQRDTFLAADPTINLKTEFVKRLGFGFFGGEGFFLERIEGTGTALLSFCGELTELKLDQGQVLKVDPGYIAAMEPSVTYDITTVPGIKNKLFGGEGLFLATLQGPGVIWLQSMPLKNLARSIMRHIPRR